MGRVNAIDLPEPRRTSRVSVEGALGEQRSVRGFTDGALSLEEL